MEFTEGLNSRPEGQVGLKKIVKMDQKNGTSSLSVIQFESFGSGGEAKAEIARLKEELANTQRELKKIKAKIQQDQEATDQKHRKEKEQIRQEAHTQGVAKGRAEAEAEFLDKEQNVLKKFYGAIESFEKERKIYFDITEEGVAAVVTAMSRRIIGEYIDLNPHIIERSVREALGYLGNEKELILLLNPEDFAWVQAHYQEWVPLTQTEINIRLKEDPRIAKGGCLLETEAGRVDVRIERMLDNLESFIHKQFEIAQATQKESK